MIGKSRLLLLAVLTSVIVVGASLSCAKLRNSGGGGRESPPSSLLSIKLQLSKAPLLNEPVTLTATVSSLYDAPSTEAWLELPTGAVYVDGALTWRGDVKAGAPVQFSATIAIVEDGRWEIKGNSYRTVVEDHEAYVGTDSVYLTMDEGRSLFGWDPRPLPNTGPFNIESLAEVDRPVGHGRWVIDGSSLVNQADQPLFLVIHNDQLLRQAQAAGLVSAERWGPWRQVLDTYWDAGLLIAVYDQKRPTTGYRVFVDRITGYGPAKKVYVRMESPSPETPVTQTPVSAYSIIAMPTQMVPRDAPSEFIFVVNGQEAARQTHPVPTAWYNRVDFMPNDELAQRAKSHVSQSRSIPLERLEAEWNGGYDYPFLWQRQTYFLVRDRAPGGQYSALVDGSGNISVYELGAVNADARIAWKYGRLDRPLYDLLQTKSDGDLVEVAIWIKGEAPNRTLAAAQQPIVDYLKSQGYEALPSDKISATFVTVPKRVLLEVAKRDDVAVILPASRFSSFRAAEARP